VSGKQEAAPVLMPLRMLGDASVPVCVDDACAVPVPANAEAEAEAEADRA
jgi:hypothetical protein